MALKPWYKIVEPREDLREGRSLDVSEFVVHPGRMRDGTAPEDYRTPVRFFGRDHRFWRLAETLLAFYLPATHEKRWVDGVLARKKGLEF